METKILSDPVVSMTVPATTEEFIVADKFVNTKKKRTDEQTDKDEVNIHFINTSFKHWFYGKKEKPVIKHTSVGRDIGQSSVDNPIIQELGGGNKAKSTFAGIWFMLEQQPDGRDGVLKIDGSGNVFFVSEDDTHPEETIRTICVRWAIAGWDIIATPVEHPGKWLPNSRVFNDYSLVA